MDDTRVPGPAAAGIVSLMRRGRTARALAAIAAPLLIAASAGSAQAASIVTEWLDDVLSAANEVAWEPTTGARFLATVHTAVYDAWSAYDPKAVGAVSGTALKGEGGPANEANEREAISHAEYAVLTALAPQRRRALTARMAALGYDPNATTPAADVGRRAARMTLAKFHADGANEADDFADTTGYRTRDPAIAEAWQPTDLFGKTQLPTTPQWNRVMPFALTRADEFRPPPPPSAGSPEWNRQIAALIETSAGLTDFQKAAAEFWAEWGSSPAPHLMELTKYASDVNDLRLDDDVKLFFLVGSTMLDASIAAWDAKYAYDYVRPITAIHALGDTAIRAWRPRSLPQVLAFSTPAAAEASYGRVASPAGVTSLRAAEWEPYLPTPAFPSYVSGHSAFCAAWARVMRLALAKPDFGYRVSLGKLYVEDRHLGRPETLDFPTYASAAEQCGQSRIWAGIHWPADNEQGLEMGRRIGEAAWQRYLQFTMGFASPATAALSTLQAPAWFHESEGSGPTPRFDDKQGLAVDLAPGAAGRWTSVTLDALPAGAYELSVKASVVGESPVGLDIEIRNSGRAEPSASTTATLAATDQVATLALDWSSVGEQTFQISFVLRSGGRTARAVVSAVDLRRIWPVVEGARRYYEPSLVGRADQ